MFGTGKREVLQVLQKDDRIPSHEEEHCDFKPRLQDLNVDAGNSLRSKVSSSAYGRRTAVAKEIPPPAPEPELTLKPAMPKSELRERARSSGYGKASIRKEKPKNYRPKPTFQPVMPPKLKFKAKYEKTVPSSGYGVKSMSNYRHKRGEHAKRTVELPANRNPTFQPQLHISKEAKKLKDETPSRLIDFLENPGVRHLPAGSKELYGDKSAQRLPEHFSPQVELLHDRDHEIYAEREAQRERERLQHNYERSEENGFVLDCIAVGSLGTALPKYVAPELPAYEPDHNTGGRQEIADGEAFEYDMNGRRVKAGSGLY